jgi:hypothetical protein
MNDIKKIQEFFSKSLEEDFGQALFNRLKPKDSDLEAIVNTLKQDPKIANSPDQASFKEALERYIRFNSDRNSIGQAAVRTLNYLNTGDRYGNGFTRIFDMLVDKNNLSEAKKETGIDMAKKQLNALGVKYEMSKTDKVRPFKVIYKPIGQSDEFYDEFEDIVDLFNLKGVVKSSMNEAKSEDKVDTITMDVPLFLRMLEYSREDASQDMDLHDVTEKAISLGKERGILQMDDYEEIVGTTEEIDEAELSEAYVPSNIKDFAKRKGVSALVNKVAGWAERVGKGIRGGTAIGKNYSTLILDMGYQTADIYINTEDETIELYGEPVRSFNEFERVYIDRQDLEENVAPNHDGKAAPFGSGYKPLEEKIAKALDSINEELCPAGKAYRKRRMAAGEKSSAYLSGRAVKVCKGQMSGKKKKK